MVERPSPLFRAFARRVVSAGADLYYGHSAHIIQGIEIYRGKPIIYNAGDFVDDYAVDYKLRNDYGILFRLKIAPQMGVERVELIPTSIANCQVNVATGSKHEAIAGRIRQLSFELGTTVREEGGAIWIDCGAAITSPEH
jgi:poly-gamma-glutamate synthesis protein (capsule biosynthesis protein)